jgi:hypothetical protein
MPQIIKRFNNMKTYISIFIMSLVILCGCVKNQTPDLEPEHITVRIWNGYDYLIKVQPADDYSVESTDESVASTNIVDASTISISTRKNGSANVRISRNNTTYYIYDFIVYDLDITKGRWTEDVYNPPSLVNSYVVETQDMSIKALIEEELGALLNSTYLYSYVFNSDNTFVMDRTKRGGGIIDGVYMFQDFTLTLQCDDLDTIYKVETLGPNIFGYLRLKEDLTAKYNALYPSAEITEVSIIKYLSTPQLSGVF